MPTRQIDETDRKLLILLQADAREPTALLARRLGLSRSTVQARLARLEASGVIEGYGVRLGAAAPVPRIEAYVAVTVKPRFNAAVGAALKKLPEIRRLSAVSGIYDLIALIATETPERMNEILDDIGAIPGVEKTTTSIVLATRVER